MTTKTPWPELLPGEVLLPLRTAPVYDLMREWRELYVRQLLGLPSKSATIPPAPVTVGGPRSVYDDAPGLESPWG